MATKNNIGDLHYTKKELRKKLAGKIEAVIPEIKNSLSEKKFNKRIKKAAKLLTEGLHLNGANKKNKDSKKKSQESKEKTVLKKAVAQSETA